MRKPLVLRSSFESVFSGIGTCCGDPFDIGSSGDEADDVLPLMRFRKRTEANMTHRLPLRCADQRQLNHGFAQNRIDMACARRPGIRKTVAGGSAARSRAFGNQPCRWDMLFRKIHGGIDFRRPMSAYHTKAICAPLQPPVPP
jgi:hypothetical protein